MEISFDVEAEGPLFDGSAPLIMDMYIYAVTARLGQEAVNRIRAYLPTVYEYPRDPESLHGTKHFVPGLYDSDIHTERQTPSINLVHDTPVVYGPWLEGVGSRNAVTRFKGYHTFRLIAQELQTEASDIAEEELPPFLVELNS